MSRAFRRILTAIVAVALGVPVMAAPTGAAPTGAAAGRVPADGSALPPGFVDQTVFTGLVAPTAVAFSPDGRVFVAEKRGTIKIFHGLTDTTPIVFADLSRNVYDYEDLGLIGLALPAGFPRDPYVYVSYTYDAPIGGVAPVYNDTCPALYNCLASGRLSRLRISGNTLVGSEQVLLNDWCQQSDTHSMGDVLFGPDGSLYVAGGDGASGDAVDYGQLGHPTNPCGDPPAPVGGMMMPPTAQGGALRSQDIRTPADPTGLSGTVIRVNPPSGAPLPSNPLYGSRDRNVQRIVAYGLRNPFRLTFRPGTGEIWIADVGFRTWEEIDRIVDPVAGPVHNYGWPCYEGMLRQPVYDAVNLSLCESLYAAGPAAVTPPFYTYAHNQMITPVDTCAANRGAIGGLTFSPTTGGGYPATYRGALFFTDYLRTCVWAMLPGVGGVPDPTQILAFGRTSGLPVQLVTGPGGDIYYVSITGGAVHRFVYR
ncbi:PQQ-dependent sugar dehydrogenase [Micromonospora zhanjiangensis]|uniref:PQQ-dependent sugar dehydrogenase n=1 Tax=Micromonospora zhanjiangensis TaxID=1522057 RepID=A0ABV8KT54_9ACTN